MSISRGLLILARKLERKRASIGGNPRLIERTVQVMLVPQQQRHCVGSFHRDLNLRRRFLRALDLDVNLTEFGRLKPQGQPLGAVSGMSERDHDRRDLRRGTGRLARLIRSCNRGCSVRRAVSGCQGCHTRQRRGTVWSLT